MATINATLYFDPLKYVRKNISLSATPVAGQHMTLLVDNVHVRLLVLAIDGVVEGEPLHVMLEADPSALPCSPEKFPGMLRQDPNWTEKQQSG